MADHLRKAAADAGRPCRILMDLAGPKLRTGDLPTVPGVIKLRPTRDRRGRVITPARACLVPDEPGRMVPLDEPRIPVSASWLANVREGDTISLRDARQARRSLRVRELSGRAVHVETDRTAYLEEGTMLHAEADDSERRCAVGSIAPVQVPVVVRPGDRIVLTADLEAATSPPPPTAPARIGCTLPEVFDHVRPGDRVWFDDGRIGAVTVAVRPGEADLEITVAAATGTKLRGEKGINLPDTDLHLSAITDDDAGVLPFVAAHADLVGMSFVQRPRDVTRLHGLLTELGANDIGIVLKIETAKAFARLPELLLAAMAHERVAVMIARGDLAVECGWERLAEVQEEILWLAEAAHLPVIWATQVLDQLARTGQPSRAEITDAAMSQRAECVMLNKGPHIVRAVEALDDILRRMSAHQQKKAPLLRRLRAWSAEPPE
jgi:pyruvate kinase